MNQDAIYDARQLGVPKMLLLGLQHMFAMFGATILQRSFQFAGQLEPCESMDLARCVVCWK